VSDLDDDWLTTTAGERRARKAASWSPSLLAAALDEMTERVIHRNPDGSERRVTILHAPEEHAEGWPGCPLCRIRTALAATSDPAPLDAETLARALASYRRSGQTSCGVLHTDGYGNPAPCPDGPIIEAEAIIRRYLSLRDTTGREPQP
jgi:hypothetical protein